MRLPEPQTIEETESQLATLIAGATALQSMDDLGSPKANEEAMDDIDELDRRAKILKEKIRTLKENPTGLS